MAASRLDPKRYVEAIRQSELSIYDSIAVGDPQFWIPTPVLEQLLDEALSGISLAGLPLRTRSKVAKQHVCRALGYPVPRSFRKVQPRFPGQCFDTYVQKSNNLQIWNESLAPGRRYVIIGVGQDDVIAKVRVVSGSTLASFDTTGTLTKKHQARLTTLGEPPAQLFTATDTDRLRPVVQAHINRLSTTSPTEDPRATELLSIRGVFDRLQTLVGESLADTGQDQERTRGASLHSIVCRRLGYETYRDDGQFPDVRHQLLEVKLQTSPTIDLGLVSPDSVNALDVPRLAGQQIRHCDVRYAVFHGETDGDLVTLTHLIVSTGERFFMRFPPFGGKVVNSKLQMPLPPRFFD